MSHLKERKETNCLNCNAEVNGKFCSVCGQENIDPAETAWHLVTHFFNDITHFDGKFFSSLKYLILKPGFLSAEYKRGRRASYLNPVRMYVFTSFIFFLVFFSVYHFEDFNLGKGYAYGSAMVDQMNDKKFEAYADKIDSTRKLTRADVKNYIDSVEASHNTMSDYKTQEQYDSMLHSNKVHDGWFMRQLNYRKIQVDEKYKGDTTKISNALIASFTHSFPQMLFVSLPLFALFLKLLYSRQKDFYYVSHTIFSIHIYIFVFIALLAIIGINELAIATGWSALNYLTGLIYIYIFIYEYKAMRNYYGQRRAKTILKYLLLNAYLMFIVILIFLVFLGISFLKV